MTGLRIKPDVSGATDRVEKPDHQKSHLRPLPARTVRSLVRRQIPHDSRSSACCRAGVTSCDMSRDRQGHKHPDLQQKSAACVVLADVLCRSGEMATGPTAMQELEALVLEQLALTDQRLGEMQERIDLQRLRLATFAGRESEKAAALLSSLLSDLSETQRHRDLLNEELRLCRLSYYAL
jgi:hypothetical protein